VLFVILGFVRVSKREELRFGVVNGVVRFVVLGEGECFGLRRMLCFGFMCFNGMVLMWDVLVLVVLVLMELIVVDGVVGSGRFLRWDNGCLWMICLERRIVLVLGVVAVEKEVFIKGK
jgi:hypothetical protein